tara:strand:+ start:283 stop:501 length:219 start_codon:yes stop_codon:yes gene_type:complete
MVVSKVGWAALIAGVLILTAYGANAVLTDPEVTHWEKWGLGLLWGGILSLLAGVAWERYKESGIDPYKDVQR